MPTGQTDRHTDTRTDARPLHNYFEFHCESATRGHSFNLRKRHCSVNSRFNFDRAHCKYVEHIATDIVNCNSLSSFKRSILGLKVKVFVKHFNEKVKICGKNRSHN